MGVATRALCITPTIIQVRVSMGLSFHEEKSMAEFVSNLCLLSDHPNPISETGTVGRDDQLNNDIDIVEWYGAHGAGFSSKSSSSPPGCVIHTRPNVFKPQKLGLYFIKTMTLLTKNKNKNTTALNADNTGTTQPTDGANDDRKFAPYPSQGQQQPALSGPSHPGFNGGPPPGTVHNTTQPSQGQYGRERGGIVGHTRQDGTEINQGQYPHPLDNPSDGQQPALSGPSHPGLNGGPPPGTVHNTTQPSQGQYGRQQPALSGPSHPGGPPPGTVHNTTQPSQGQYGTENNQGQYPQPLGNPSHGAYTAGGHTQRVDHPADSPTNTTTGWGGSSLQQTVGKIETAIGSMIGSNSLKDKGQQKERGANFKNIQAAEIAEAERLEKEALMRRGRAVDHGAHPAYSALGGPGGPGGPRTNN